MSDENFKGAGVLLVCMVANIPSVVLVYSKSKNAWEEPGGGYEKLKPISQTAQKELFEETAKLIDVPCDVLTQFPFIDIKTKKKQLVYRLYIVNVCFPITRHHSVKNHIDILRDKFATNLESLLQDDSTPEEYLESSDISFVPLKLFNNIQPVVPRGEKKRFFVQLPNGEKTIITKRLKNIMMHERFPETIVESFTNTQPLKLF